MRSSASSVGACTASRSIGIRLGYGKRSDPKRAFTPRRRRFDQWVHFERSAFFTVGDGYMLELVEHAYDTTITVRYFGRVGL